VVSDDGNIVAFLSNADSGLVTGAAPGPHVYVRNMSLGQTTLAPEPADWTAQSTADRTIERLTMSGDGSRVAYLALVWMIVSQSLVSTVHTAVVADLATQQITPSPVPSDTRFFSLSAGRSRDGVGRRHPRRPPAAKHAGPTRRRHGSDDDGFRHPAGRTGFRIAECPVRAHHQQHAVTTFDFGTATTLGFGLDKADFSAGDRWLTVDSRTATLVGGDSNGVATCS
jgi:hypothetical protein